VRLFPTVDLTLSSFGGFGPAVHPGIRINAKDTGADADLNAVIGDR
jgi:hypothetical protein